MNNKQREAVAHHLSQPENRIRYCYEFMNGGDEELANNAFSMALYWISMAEDKEAHF